MTARMPATLALLVALSVLASCWPFRKAKPVPQPAKIPVQTQPVPAPPPKLEPPPQIPANTQSESHVPLPPMETQPLPPPPPAKKLPSRPAPRVQPPAAEAPPPPPAPAPQLVPVLTAAQRQELENSVNERISRAQNILASIAGKRLSSEQENTVGQIRTFLKQAEEARGSDLLRANNLAERARVLAEELARRLR
jgi:type IV secretory pathway VirB10-like protein